MTCQELLIAWLNNAYSMEMGIIKTLEDHAEDASAVPEVRKKLEDHIELTQNQADRIRDEIERLGGEVSEVKAAFSQAFGTISGIASGLARDKIVKNTIAEHATEHFEMATYMAIAKAADICGEEETAQLAREIMEEEKTTGEELEEYIGMVVRQYIDENTED